MTPGNRHSYTTFIDNGLIYSDGGGSGNFSLSIGGLAKNN